MLALAAFGTLLAAQEIPWGETRPAIRIRSLRPDRTEVRVGESFRLEFELEVPAGYRVYPAAKSRYPKKPMVFHFEGIEPAGKIEEPPPKHHKDEFDEYDFHEGVLTVVVPVRLGPGPSPGPFRGNGRIEYEMCGQDSCLPAKTPFSFEVTVLPGRVAPVPAAEEGTEVPGFWGMILLGMLGGLVSLAMPCTYPIVPVTVTYFLKQAAGSRAKGLRLSGVYSLGIVLSFTGIGFLMTLLLGAGGPTIFAASPWVNGGVSLLFFWFAGSLFGLYEIRIPFGLGGRLPGGAGSGVGGAFLLGLLFSVVTFTCTIPIAATILAMAAGQYRLAALVAMLAYSVTMALPFFLMGLFPAAIREVPRGGGWLNTVKVTMGFVEVGLALYYLSKADQVKQVNLLSRGVMAVVWAILLGVTAVYLLDFCRSRPRPPRVLAAALFGALGAYMATGVSGRSLGPPDILLPPPPIHGTTLPAALEEAAKRKRPLFAEFTGLTCTNCLWNRGTILADAEVRALLQRYVVAELWTDRDLPMDRDNRKTLDEKFGPALPLYVLFAPDGREIARIGGRPSKRAFLDFLRKGLAEAGP